MKLPTYPTCKPSDIEWVGNVPEHWSVVRSDSMLTTSKQQIAPEDFAGIDVMHYSIPVVQRQGSGAVENGDDIASAKQLIDEPVVLVSRLNPRKATICFAAPDNDLPTLASTEFVALKPANGDIRFLKYLVSSEPFRQRLDSCVQSVTRSHQRVRPDQIYRFWSAWPEPDEQRQISNFLDHETAKIDELVEKKRSLIERLEEKRIALITSAVTTGLNPAAAVKPSGIEWLDQLPAHWSSNHKLVYLAASERNSIVNGPFGSDLLTSELVSEGVPVLYSGDVKACGFSRNSAKHVTDAKAQELDFCRTEPGDILIAKVGNPPGDACIYPKTEPAAVVTQDVVRIRIEPRVADPRFLTYLLNSKLGRYLARLITVEATRGRFSLDDLRNIRFPLPPISEQHAIAELLDRETKKINEMVAMVREAIERLQEYRMALISAAVTGKIDVREVSA